MTGSSDSAEWRVEVKVRDPRRDTDLSRIIGAIKADLGSRANVTIDKATAFVYVDSEDAARNAGGMIGASAEAGSLPVDVDIKFWSTVSASWLMPGAPEPDLPVGVSGDGSPETAGLYDDPDAPGRERWWDGRMWWPYREAGWPKAVDLACPGCGAQVRLPPEADLLACPSCTHHYRFAFCERCGCAREVPTPNLGKANCRWCGKRSVARAPAVAAHVWFEIERRGLLEHDPDRKALGGFTVVGGSGETLPPSTKCMVMLLPTMADIRGDSSEDGIRLPYSDLTIVQLHGGKTVRGGGFIGGGFGMQAAAEGMLVASALNALTTRTRVNTLIHLGTSRGEIIMHHGKWTPTALRMEMSRLFTAYEAAKRSWQTPLAPDPIAQLERLRELKASGTISGEEFEAARSRYARQLTEGS